jgi:hypothetical protein
MAKTPTVKEMQAALAGRPYKDAPTQTIDDWKWHPMEHIKAQLAERRELPTHVEKYAEFMQEMNAKAQAGTLTPRDLIKAHTITQSSIGRGGLSHSTATSRDMKLPNTGGEVRPEGAFAEWLGSPMGQKYLDAAERGEVHQPAIADLMAKFAPFGKQNVQGEAMKYAAQTLPQRSASANYAVTGPKQEYRDFARKIRGIAGAKSGFIGSLLGRGDQPTLDARQLNLHSLSHPTKVPESMMDRQRGLGGTEAVDRLTARQEALGYKIPKELKPFAQHLIHHDVWDQMGGTQTTHEDLIKAMRGYADGGDVEAMKREMDVKRFAKGGAQTWPANLPPAPVPSNQEMTAIVDRIARQQLGEHVTKPGETTNLAGRSIKEAKRIKQTQYELKPTREVRPTPVYAAKTGDVNVVLPGDQTISDQQLVSLNDKPIGSDQEGGSRYGEGKLHLPKARRPFWASGPGPAQGFQNRVTELAQITGQEPSVIAHHLAMARPGNNFALHFADANLKAIGNSEIKPEHKETFNTVMQQGFPSTDKKGNPIQVTFPHWPGVENPTLSYKAMQADPEMRKWFNNRMKTSNLTKALGFPNGLDVEYAISEPELRNMEINMTGHAVGKMVPGAKLVPGADHNTYSHKILGTSLGRAPELAPMELSFLDATHYIKPKLSSPGAYTRTMSLSAPHQVVDDRYLNMMNDYYTKLRAVRGYAEGGKAEPDLDEMRLANTLRKPKKALDIRSVGVDEAPDMAVKTYVSPGLGKATTLPIGGVDFAPMMPGQQLAPGAGTPGQPQPPQQGGPGGPGEAPPAGPPGSEVPMGGPAPGVAPVGQSPQTPQSNILAMTRQGQALRALTPVLPPPIKKAVGGVVGSRNFQDGGEVTDLPEVRATVKDKNLQRKVPEMEAAAKALQEGVINRKEYDRVVKKHKPVKPYDFVPQPATNENALRALHDNKKPTWRGAEQWPAGRKVGLRLDIPAYEDHGVWVNSIHDEEGEGKDKLKTSYGPVSSVKNATFDASPNKAVRVATGEQSKSPFARIKGELHHMTEDEAVKHIQKNLHHPDYAQVGMDPRRHGYFYDRKTLKPVTHSAHVVQIGPLVLAHKPTYGKRETYKAGGVVNMAGGSKEANLRAMREEILQQKGQYGARRLDRAADEIRNLSKLYTPQALREAFTGDNAQAIMSMNPAHFERYAKPLEYQTHKMDPATIASRKAYDAREGTHQLKRAIPTGDYIQHLVDIAQSGGFEDVPYLKIDKERAGDQAMLNELYAKYGAVRPITPHLVGHEGRHRNRALAAMGQRKGLVRLFPRAELREPLPRRSQEEYIEALLKEIPGNMVTPEPLGEHRDEYIRRGAIALPDFYNKGGSVEQMSAEMREKGKQKFLAPSAVKQVMYHGTAQDIKEFRPKQVNATFLSPDPKFAHGFAQMSEEWMKLHPREVFSPEQHAALLNEADQESARWSKTLGRPTKLHELESMEERAHERNMPSAQNIMPVHVQAKNPFDYENPRHMQALRNYLPKRQQYLLDEGGETPVGGNNWRFIESEPIQNAIKDMGHDSFWSVEHGAKNLGVYNPKAIKSAIGNRGTYDTSHADLTKKRGGKVTLPASKEQMERELKRASHFKQKV